jgi:hypothetical protein
MTSLTSEQIQEATTLRLHLPRVQQAALLVGVGGLLLCGAGALWSHEQFYQSYLFAYLFWLGPALGAVALVMLSHVAGGRWSVITRRIFEASALTLPLLALLFVPFLFGIPVLYAWARPEEIATSELLQKKLLYLNEPFFIGRAVLYFAIWSGLALLLSRWSRAHDATARPGLVAWMQGLSGAGLVLYALTLTFAVTDWGMSLDYHWFSTIYGMRFVAGQGLTTFALAIVLLALLRRRQPWDRLIKPGIFHDLGTLLFVFVILWAYMSFSQYLIIWSGNLAEEVPWYVRRQEAGWSLLGLLLIGFHFALPFFLLLARRAKSSARMLASIAAGILLARVLDTYWLIEPEFQQGLLESLSWLHLAALAGIGGAWLAAFLWLAQRRPFLPCHDARLAEALTYD